MEISYVIIGVLPGQICGGVAACQTSQNISVYEDQCVKDCPVDTKKVSYIDGGV